MKRRQVELKPVINRRPTLVASVTAVKIGQRTLRVLRRSDEPWGQDPETETLVLDAVKDICPAYGREIVEAVARIPGVVRVELLDQFGCGVALEWGAT